MDYTSFVSGLSPPLLFAAFLGSCVYIASQEGPPKSWWNIVSPILAGTPTGTYLAHFAVSHFFDEASSNGTGAAAAAFAIGAGGPWVARGLLSRVKSWGFNGNGKSPYANGTNGNGSKP